MSIEALIQRWGALLIETARTLGHEALAAVLSYLVDVHGSRIERSCSPRASTAASSSRRS
jgi:hypothetical protein